jgi:hypothetical protein
MSRRKKKAAQTGTAEQQRIAYFAGKVAPEKIRQAYHNIAVRMGAGYLVCDNCTRTQDLTVDHMEAYLRKGWPVCCPGTANGGTMRYCRAEERGKRA